MAEKLDNKILVKIKNEIKIAEKRIEDDLIPCMRENLARYMGVHIPDIAVDWDIVLNEIYPIVQFNMPSIFYRNPRVFLKPRNKFFIAKKRNPLTEMMEEFQIESQKSARTQEAILNYTIDRIGYKKESRRVLFDALVSKYGVMWHGYKGEFGMTEEQSIYIESEQCFVKRLSPTRFLFDPSVNISNLDEARWTGRSFDIPLDDLLEDDTLDVDKKELKGEMGFGQLAGKYELDKLKSGGNDVKNVESVLKPLIEFADNEYKKSSSCRFVTIYEILLRPSKKERREGSKGQMILITDEQTKPLRVSKWPYKAEGWPAKILQFNEIVDSAFGLDDISTYKAIADNKNSIRNLQLRNANESSKVWVAIAKEGANEEDVDKIKVGDQTILMFEGNTVQGKMQVASPGAGASNELYLIDTRIDRELQDKSGVSDLKKGFLQSGEESATSVQLRAAGGSVRPQYRQDIMADFLKESFGYLKDLLRQFVPVKEAVRIIGSLDLEWSENPSKEELQADTDVELDVISMLPENPEKEVQELRMLLDLATQALTNPSVLTKIQQEGKTFNLSPIIDSLLQRLKIRDPEVFRGIRPEESQGFVSVAELRAAQANISAIMSGQEMPSPPAQGQDSRARLELYSSVNQLLNALGQRVEVLEQLMMMQAQILQAEEEKNNPQAGGKVNTQTVRNAI